MGPYRTQLASTAPARRPDRRWSDPAIPVLLVVASLPPVLVALLRGGAWGVEESVAAGVLTLTLANVGAGAWRRRREASSPAVVECPAPPDADDQA